MLHAIPSPARLCAHAFSRQLATPAAIAATVSDPALIALGRSVFFGSRRAEVTFFLGPPGAGKSTLSEMACDRLGYKHVSVGELLREEIQRDSEIGVQIAPIVETGGLVPSAVSVKLLLGHLKRALQERAVAQVDQWIVDGFPRKVSSAQVWERLGLTPKRVLALEVDEDVMRRRLGLRGRVDDVPDVILERFQVHRQEWPTIESFYRSRGLLTLIDGNGSPEEVWQRFLGAVAATHSGKAT